MISDEQKKRVFFVFMICFAQIAFFFPVNSAKLVNIQTYTVINGKERNWKVLCN